MADFKPYLLKSTDAGKTWTSIAGNLPERGQVLALAEDHGDPNLLFVGTEFALYFTLDGGKRWTRLKAGLPTIAVKDLAVQKQENDLVVGTFGRGIYVLDDYTPLRALRPETLAQEAALFPVKNALLYVPTRQYGLRGKAFLGESFYTADNPPFGATFTYHLKEEVKTKKQQRRDAEKAAAKKDAAPPYPSRDQLRAEAEEEAPVALLTITDTSGRVVRTLTGPVKQGVQRVSWDLRHPGPTLPRARTTEADEDIFSEPPSGPLVAPGTYRVSLAKRVDGVVTPLAGPQEFQVVADGANAADLKALAEFQQQVLRLERAVHGTVEAANDVGRRLEQIRRALDQTPAAEEKWKAAVRELEKRNRDILRALRGDNVLRARNENVPEAVTQRLADVVRGLAFTLGRPTQTQRESYRIAGEELTAALGALRQLIDVDLKDLEKALDLAGAPWTPGRLPEWKGK
jgi:hypothetical protein